jgi:acyl-CoA thioesterase-2
MNPLLADVLQLLRLQRLDTDVFLGESRNLGDGHVFGGQALGQALAAAYETVEARDVHSLHAYFLRAGNATQPIRYEVERSRDGRSFSSRRVVALQERRQIFHMAVSFQAIENATDRQASMPAAPDPESLPDMAAAVEEMKRKAPHRPRLFRLHQYAFEFRAAQLPDPLADIPAEPHMKIWFRAVGRAPDDPILHRCLLAYASDYYLLGVAGLDARMAVERSDLQMTSIDHAMWFHRPARADEWLLYVLDSPTASGSRGLARGSIFSRDGRLVASTVQEGLVRRRSG